MLEDGAVCAVDVEPTLQDLTPNMFSDAHLGGLMNHQGDHSI